MKITTKNLSTFSAIVSAIGSSSFLLSHLLFKFQLTNTIGLLLILPYNLSLLFVLPGSGISLYGLLFSRNPDRTTIAVNVGTLLLNTLLTLSFFTGWLPAN